VAAGESFSASWSTTIHAIGSVIGTNDFTLAAEDVTPAPFNQPRYPPEGDCDSGRGTVTASTP
jgi:hypothetical protein